VAQLLSLLAAHADSAAFCVLRYSPAQVPRAEQRLGWDDGMIHLCCLGINFFFPVFFFFLSLLVEASLAMKLPLQLFPIMLITSATLSPLEMFPKLLGLRPALLESIPAISSRKCLLPLIVCKGQDQTLLSSRFQSRDEPQTPRNYALLVLELCSVVRPFLFSFFSLFFSSQVPDGMICFFPSYGFMETCIAAWHSGGQLAQMLKQKLVFIETRNSQETAVALESFQRACDSGRGALLLSVARGKVS
jgi:DNA excision repair protein ERCC-2